MQVDFYLASLSNSVILPNAKCLYGDDSLPRGEWKLSVDATERKSLRKDVGFLIVMSFIFIKGVLRKWERTDLEEVIQKVYQRIQEKSGKKLNPLPKKISRELIRALLDNLGTVANASQRKAIERIRNESDRI